MRYAQTEDIKVAIDTAKSIVIIQADNPDGDSLASSLALEQILYDLGKDPVMYCGIEMPTYLRYLNGWDRVTNELPKNFDLSIIVDNSSLSLLESIKHEDMKRLSSKQCIVLDHHATEITIPFVSINCNQKAVATGEIIYEIADSLKWPLKLHTLEMITTSILSDSLGLISEGTTARSIHIIAEIVDKGVSLAALEDSRRQLMRKSPEILKYKGTLLQRIEYYYDNRIAVITIPWSEIEEYSHEYNPSMLVIDEMRQTTGTDIAIAFKTYNSGKITAKIRCNYGISIAAELAEHFGGGGHPYASGFKVESNNERTFDQIKSECINFAYELIENVKTT